MQYVCLRCGEGFEQPHILMVRHTETQPEWWEKVRQSPCCAEGYAPASTCPGCGRVTASVQSGKLCGSCVGRAGERLRRFLAEEYIPEEREALDEMFEGISFTQLAETERGKEERDDK